MRARDRNILLEAMEEAQGIPEVETAPVVDEPLPDFPRLPGVLGHVVEGITPDVAYDHKALAVLTFVGLALSGRARLKTDFFQPRFYAGLVGPFGSGKSAALNEVRRALSPIMPFTVTPSIDSGPALVEALQENPVTLYFPDELADAFEKGKSSPNSRNTLLGEFLKLYEGNETGRRIVERQGKPLHVTNAHFAIVGGVTTDRFESMWTGSGSSGSGLQSRFVLSYSEQLLPPLKTPNNDLLLSTATADLGKILQGSEWLLSLTNGAEDAICWWTMDKDLSRHRRVLDMAKRFALIVAVTLGESAISEETMKLGLQFADYQRALYEKLMPNDAASYIQAFENRILKFFGRHEKATEWDLKKNLRPENCPGGFGPYLQALRNLRISEAIRKVGETRKGSTLWAAV